MNTAVRSLVKLITAIRRLIAHSLDGWYEGIAMLKGFYGAKQNEEQLNVVE